MRRVTFIFLVLNFLAISLSTTAYANENDPLPSWREGAAKNHIIHFVQAVTNTASPDFVAAKDRIATIDNDGTLWLEQPVYTQFIFLVESIRALAKNHPELKKNPLLQPVFSNDYTKLTEKNLSAIFAATSTGITVEEYTKKIRQWLATAKNPRFKRPYTELIYQPMLEVINYLSANQFQVYIVSGGGQEFIRAFSENTYHIPSERVIGSATKSNYSYQNGHPQLIKLAQSLFICNYAGKPEAINLIIGKKPIIAFGNSDGDKEMLEWTQSNTGKTLMLLIRHDDAEREYAYGPKTKVGVLSAPVLTFAKLHNWQLVSMKNDWKVIFP